MTQPVATDVQSVMPPNNALRIGVVTHDDLGNLVVSVQGEVISNVGWLDLSGQLAIDGPIAILRGDASWLALGRVATAHTSPRIATSVVTTSSGTFTALTQIMSVTAPQLYAGCTYKVAAYYHIASSVVNDIVSTRLRPDSISTADIQLDFNILITSTSGVASYIEAEYTPSTDETNKVFVLGAQRVSGTGNVSLNAAATFPSYMYVDYIRGPS